MSEENNNPFSQNRPPSARITAAVSEGAIQREIADVQGAMVIAKRFPRDPIAAMDRILQACARPTLAEEASYQYAKGGTDITGPSIRLAEVIAQNWGNMTAGVTILSSDAGKSECIAYAHDLETNFRDEKRFTVKHWRDTKSGGYPIKDEREIYELAANMGARRKRACILAVIPGDVIEAAERQCEVTLKTHLEITPEFIKRVVTAFAKLGVTQEQIEQRIQRRLETLTPALAMQLKKIQTSINDGMSAPEDWFEVVGGAAPATGAAGLKQAVVTSKKREKREDDGDDKTATDEGDVSGIPVGEQANLNNRAGRDSPRSAENQGGNSLPETSRAQEAGGSPAPREVATASTTPATLLIDQIRAAKNADKVDELLDLTNGGDYTNLEVGSIRLAAQNRKEVLEAAPTAKPRRGGVE